MKFSRGVLLLALFGNAAAAAVAGDVINTVEEVEHTTANERRRMPKHEEYYHPVPMPTYHYIQAAYPKTPYPTHRPPTPYPTGRAPTPKPTPYPTPYPTPHPVQPYRPPPKTYPEPNYDPYQPPPKYPEPNYDPYYPPPNPLPTRRPTLNPTVHPTPDPTSRPTPAPTRPPTRPPTLPPTVAPTARPTTVAPTTRRPTVAPTPVPTHRPTPIPTTKPTFVPTKRPSAAPSISDTPTTSHPSHPPSENPTNSEEPSDNPTQSEEPSDVPTQSEEPSDVPTQSEEPSEFPTQSEEPSEFPTQSEEPSENPTFFFIRFDDDDDDDDAFRTIFPRPIPQPIVQRVTLLQVICAPANAGVLGEFCRAIRFVGLADVLNNGAILGNANGLIAGQIQNNANLVVNNALLNANVQPGGGGFREGGFQVVDFGGKRKLVAKESVELEEEQSRTEKADGRDLQVPLNSDGYNYDYIAPQTQVGGIIVSNNVVNNQLPLPLDQYTVFGPTNAAFERLGRETLDYLYSDAGRDVFRNIINYHIINRRLSFNELNCDTDYVMRNGETTRTKCRIGGEKFQVGQGNTQRRDEPKIVFYDTFAVNGVLDIVDHVIQPNIREPTRPPTFSPTPATCICDNATCLGGVRMTYNRQRCDPTTTQHQIESGLNYCKDDIGGLLPTGIDSSDRVGYSLFNCDNRVDEIGGSDTFVLNGESFDFNIRALVGECLPQCLQVIIFAYTEGTTDIAVLQTFNVDTSCAGNTLVGNTNYGAFYYPGENFNVMCPVGKK